MVQRTALALPVNTHEAARDAALRAEAASHRALARRPPAPFAWAQLAQLSLAFGRDPIRIGEAAHARPAGRRARRP